ncbi:sialidase-3-like isoform X2 [Pristis pectinata]|nr:sialidase-3-like isoform X2 [Pristis pectinata]XP_051882348.1 sialidase-3-like isoform X2 [Pristis pectinata]XP_051882349.1 sialidase-3-like isoform X2 [Pristis pectinata]
MAADQVSGKVTLFKREESEAVYRIPSLLYLDRDAVFLAFAEKRSSSSDLDAKSLVLRRGNFQDGSVKWENEVQLKTAGQPGYRSMNPCPVYEQQQGVVYLFFNCIKEGVSERQQIFCGKDATKLCYVLSRDAGVTWGPLTDLTDTVLGPWVGHWGTFSVGPGHGLQQACGTLIIPAYTYIISQSCRLLPPWFRTAPHPFYFYSQDGGESWQVGEPVTKYQAAECELAEIAIANNNRVLYCNARTKGQARVEAVSLEPGCFEIARLAKGLVDSKRGCQGSVVSFPVPDVQPNTGEQVSWLLYTHPTGERGFWGHRHNRTNLGIFVNPRPLQKHQWRGPWVIQTGPCGYSDLAYVGSAATFACLYECGTDVSWERIVFCLFSAKDVMKNVSSRHGSEPAEGRQLLAGAL